MTDKKFDRIDIASSVVAHHIYHVVVDKADKLSASFTMMAHMRVVEDERLPCVTWLTHLEGMAERKATLRAALEEDIDDTEVFGKVFDEVAKPSGATRQNFREVVSSKMFELFLSDHTRRLHNRMRQKVGEDGNAAIGFSGMEDEA